MSEITSQYTIHRYVGREPLDLMTPPTAVGSGTSILAQSSQDHDILWNRLIDNTLTIHATEIADGSIPVFFTSLDENDTSSRIPNTNSTLQELSPGHSYYFIMRSQSNLPITLPEIGGKLTGCDINECSTVSIEELNDINLVGKSNNKQFITVCASGLTCGETYSFDFSTPVSNWPTYINPISGTFIAAKENVEIPAEITFSKETGNLDPEGLMDYKIYKDINYHPCHTEDFNVYSIIKATIKPISYKGLHDEEIFKIHCIDCLPECEPYASVRFVDNPLKTLTLECCQQNQNIVIDVKSARLGELYDYRIISDSIHPVNITPSSGTVGFGKYYHDLAYFDATPSNNEILNGFSELVGGQINTLFNLMQNVDAVLKVELTHRNTQTVSTDYLTVVCSGCT